MAGDSSPTREADILERCQNAIGYRFRRPALLRAALTHASGANTRLASNERLEFLGDAILGLVTCEQLFLRFPEYEEGDLTRVKSSVVSRGACARFSQRLGLGEFLFVGKGLHQQRDVPLSLLADVFESLVAAIYLDGGLEPAKEFLLPFLHPEIDQVANNAVVNNAKSHLQQLSQREFGGIPRYLVLDEQGPDHNKCFKVAAEVNRHRFPAAWGRNKKEAEAKAALNALAALSQEPIPYPSD